MVRSRDSAAERSADDAGPSGSKSAASSSSYSSLIKLLPRDALLRPHGSIWAWQPSALRVPPSDHMLGACGFGGSVWAPNTPRNNPNLLLLLHGLGDTPDPFAAFANKLALPQTSALSLRGPLALPLDDLPGRMWHESFDVDGTLMTGEAARRGRVEGVRARSLGHATRRRLYALLQVLESGCGWPRERIFLFGYAQGGTAVLDLLSHIEEDHSGGGSRRLGGVISWCGLPLTETLFDAIAASTSAAAAAAAPKRRSSSPPVAPRTSSRRRRDPPILRRAHIHLAAASRAVEPPLQSLHLLDGQRRRYGRLSPADARLLMEFFSRHLALDSALADDPDVVRVS